MTEQVQQRETRRSALLAGVTVEVALYGVIGLAALWIRLADLGRWPLQAGEATTALAAWRALHGGGDAFGAHPLLYNVSWLLFGLTGASDVTLRLLPALVGAGLAVAPYWARDLLGRTGALAAAVLLCLAPTWVTYSRTAASPILTAAVGALLLVGVWRVVHGEHRRAVRLLAVGVGLGPVAGAGYYTALLAVILFGALWWRSADETVRQHLRRVWAGPMLRQNLMLAGGLLVLSSTGLLLNLGGIGMTVQEAARWVSGLWPHAGAGAPWQFGRLLLGYEALTLALAAVALWRALRERQAVDGLLALWAGLALLLGTLGGHRGPEWATDALLPLVALAGRGAQWLWDELCDHWQATDSAALAFDLAMAAIAYLSVAAYTQNDLRNYLWLAIVCVVLAVISVVGYGLWAGRVVALRLAAVALAVILAVPTIRATASLTTATGRDPRELLVGATVSPQLGELAAELPALSARLTGNTRDLEVAYEADLDPWLGWYLRDFGNAHAVETVGPAPTAAVLITAGCDGALMPDYAGRCYRLTQDPSAPAGGTARLRWLLFREPAEESAGRQITLWERLPESAG